MQQSEPMMVGSASREWEFDKILLKYLKSSGAGEGLKKKNCQLNSRITYLIPNPRAHVCY